MSFSKLDRVSIIREAVALLAEEGLEAVSLRKIANRLGVSVSSLYWHVTDKGALYGLMSQSIFRACIDAVPGVATWQAWLHGFGLALWDAQISIPDARQLLVAARPEPGAVETSLATILHQLGALGLPEERARLAQRSVQALVTGWTTLRSARPDAAASEREGFVLALEMMIDGWSVHFARAQVAPDRPVEAPAEPC